MSKPTLPLKGGCQCGALRYEVSEAPLMVYCCHCTNCQRISGTAFAISVTLKEDSFTFTKGTAAIHQWTSDAGNLRNGSYCADCGVRIAHGGSVRGIMSLRGSTLDDRGWLRPAGHIWVRSAYPWMVFEDDALLFDEQPTDYTSLVERFQSWDLFN